MSNNVLTCMILHVNVWEFPCSHFPTASVRCVPPSGTQDSGIAGSNLASFSAVRTALLLWPIPTYTVTLTYITL